MRRTLLSSLLLATLAPCQLLVVDPAGGGTHTDLQTAINAAPAGAVILVMGGVWGPLVITRSVTLVGNNTPQVQAPVMGLGQQPPAITLQGGGSATFVMAGFQVQGTANGTTWNTAGRGLVSDGFAKLTLYDCTVRGHEWFNVTGSADSAGAILVNGVATLLIERCTIRATTSYADANNWTPPGAPAIAAAASTVLVFNSTVTGGSAGPTLWTFGPPSAIPCPCPSPLGLGGPGVVAQNIVAAATILQGGHGSTVTLGPPQSPPNTPWGAQPDGAPYMASAMTTLTANLSQFAPLRLGATHIVVFPATTGLSFLALGTPLTTPIPVLGAPYVFVDPTQLLALPLLSVGAASYSFPVPAAQSLIGYQLAEQRFDLTSLGTLVGSNPILGTVTP